MEKLLFIILCLVVNNIFAAPSPEVLLSEKHKENITKELSALKSAPEIKFAENLEKISKQINEYVSYRIQECNGEFSSIVIDKSGESKKIIKKLNRSERKSCLLNLMKYRKVFLNDLFDIRKNYLAQVHKEQLYELEEMRLLLLDEIDKTASKIK